MSFLSQLHIGKRRFSNKLNSHIISGWFMENLEILPFKNDSDVLVIQSSFLKFSFAAAKSIEF